MFEHTFSNIKSSFKKGGSFLRSCSLDFITAIRDDICQEVQLHKEFKEFKKAQNSSETSEKSE